MGGDIAEFASDEAGLRRAYPKDELRNVAATEPPSAGSGPGMVTSALTQWAVCGPHEYTGVSQTQKTLHAGVYSVGINPKGEVYFTKVDTKVDDLMEFPDSVHDRILHEISDFWSRNDKFREFGFLHRRGYLFYGPPGSGKTGIVSQIMLRIVRGGDIVFLCSTPKIMSLGLAQFRQVEPKRRVVCVFEDIDAIINEHGEDALLSILDGENQIDCCLNIATTNYPERLPRRIVARPRRFDRIEKIGMPSEAVRRLYLRNKLRDESDEQTLDRWVKLTDGLSFAALSETVISVKCLGNDLDETIEILRSMAASKASSDEFDKKEIGIRA